MASQTSSLVLFLVAVLHLSAAAPQGGGGGVRCIIPGQVYMECGSACPPTCDNPNPICPLVCVPGCQCPRGTVFHNNRCLPPKACPPECPIPGQVYMECGSACPPTCDNPNPICTPVCEEGCQCPRGTVLQGNRCVQPQDCVVGWEVRQQTACPIPGQVYTDCGSACPPTCEVPNPLCTDKCVPGCQCPKGTILDGDRCVSRDRCLS